MTGIKRDIHGNSRAAGAAAATPAGSRIRAMFETFRDELDEHHDRRERIVKASRDVTAQSKKMWVSFLPFLSSSPLTGPVPGVKFRVC